MIGLELPLSPLFSLTFGRDPCSILERANPSPNFGTIAPSNQLSSPGDTSRLIDSLTLDGIRKQFREGSNEGLPFLSTIRFMRFSIRAKGIPIEWDLDTM